MRISDWSSDVCSSDLAGVGEDRRKASEAERAEPVRKGEPRHRDGDHEGGRRAAAIGAEEGEIEHFRQRHPGHRDEEQRRQRDEVDEAVEGLAALLAEDRSEEHTSELQSLMRISYAVFCWKKKKHKKQYIINTTTVYDQTQPNTAC